MQNGGWRMEAETAKAEKLKAERKTIGELRMKDGGWGRSAKC